jgi:hypothetical protein
MLSSDGGQRYKLTRLDRVRILISVLLAIGAAGLIALGMAQPPKSAQVTR